MFTNQCTQKQKMIAELSKQLEDKNNELSTAIESLLISEDCKSKYTELC